MSLCFLSVEYAHASEHKDWTVSNNTGIVRYISNGSTVNGHQFGFIKKAGSCDGDLLWIAWSSYKTGIENFVDQDAIIQFRVDDIKFQLGIPLLTIYDYTPNIKLAAFTNFIVSEKFISLLKSGKNIEVTIIGPDELVDKIDIKTDSFSLNGFKDARVKAKEFCTVT